MANLKFHPTNSNNQMLNNSMTKDLNEELSNTEDAAKSQVHKEDNVVRFMF